LWADRGVEYRPELGDDDVQRGQPALRPGEDLDRAVALASQLGSYPAAVYAATRRDLQQPALQAVSAGDDAAVTAAWSSPQTRQRLARHLAALAAKPTARTPA
jgi:predicted kinase